MLDEVFAKELSYKGIEIGRFVQLFYINYWSTPDEVFAKGLSYQGVKIDRFVQLWTIHYYQSGSRI